MKKEILGGNVNQAIEKKENKIYRNSNWNNNIHEFLQFLETKHFAGVPRFLGIDENNREILSYLPGYVPGNSFPNCQEFVWNRQNLILTAQFMRKFHDISSEFLKQTNWEQGPFQKCDYEVICHNDAAPYNFVYEDKKMTGLIDFDVAYPGMRLWDIAYTLYTTIPLSSYQPELDGTVRFYEGKDADIRKERIQIFFRSYGMEIPVDLFSWVIRRLEELCNFIQQEAQAGNAAFKEMVNNGEITYYQNEINFIKENCYAWK